jgi:hypothetical protein
MEDRLPGHAALAIAPSLIELAVTQKALPKQALDDAARAAEPLIKQG